MLNTSVSRKCPILSTTLPGGKDKSTNKKILLGLIFKAIYGEEAEGDAGPVAVEDRGEDGVEEAEGDAGPVGC